MIYALMSHLASGIRVGERGFAPSTSRQLVIWQRLTPHSQWRDPHEGAIRL